MDRREGGRGRFGRRRRNGRFVKEGGGGGGGGEGKRGIGSRRLEMVEGGDGASRAVEGEYRIN